MKKRSLIQFWVAISTLPLLMYNVIGSNYSYIQNAITMLVVFILSLILVFIFRKSMLLLVLLSIVSYANYSILFGIYIKGSYISAHITSVLTVYNLGLAANIMLLFFIIIIITSGNIDMESTNFGISYKVKSNNVIVVGLYVIMIGILLYSIQTSTRSESYAGGTLNTAFEYSYLLLIIIAIYSGRQKWASITTTAITILFVLTDFYFGGRISAFQFILAYLLTTQIQNLNFKRLILIGIGLAFLATLIGYFRMDFSTSEGNVKQALEKLMYSRFVDGTSVQSFASSITVLEAKDIISEPMRAISFKGFIKEMLGLDLFGLTSTLESELSRITSYVSNNLFYNIGGTFFPFHFYFWFGWIGVILAGIILGTSIRFVAKIKNNSNYLYIAMGTAITVTTLRWYIYSPLSLLRPAFVLLPIMILVCNLVNDAMRNSMNNKK